MANEKRLIQQTIKIINETIQILEEKIYPRMKRLERESLNHRKGALLRSLIGLNEINRILPCGPQRKIILNRKVNSLEIDLNRNFPIESKTINK